MRKIAIAFLFLLFVVAAIGQVTTFASDPPWL